MKKLITSVLGLLSVTASGLTLHAEEHTPRLVIGVHIDQLDENYLEWFAGGFTEDGFRKVLQSGTHVTDVVYPSSQPDHAAAVASFITGASPRQNGITGSQWYDRSTGKRVSCIADTRFFRQLYSGQRFSEKSSGIHTGRRTAESQRQQRQSFFHWYRCGQHRTAGRTHCQCSLLAGQCKWKMVYFNLVQLHALVVAKHQRQGEQG